MISREHFLDFIRKKKETYAKAGTLTYATRYYLRQFDQHAGQSWFASWNWAAALFPVSWMLYRRMYLYSFLYMLIHDLQSLWIESYVVKGLSFLAMGILGNNLYFYFINAKFAKGIHARRPTGWALWIYYLFAPLVSACVLFISAEEKKAFRILEFPYKVVYFMESKEGVQYLQAFQKNFRQYVLESSCTSCQPSSKDSE